MLFAKEARAAPGRPGANELTYFLSATTSSTRSFLVVSQHRSHFVPEKMPSVGVATTSIIRGSNVGGAMETARPAFAPSAITVNKFEYLVFAADIPDLCNGGSPNSAKRASLLVCRPRAGRRSSASGCFAAIKTLQPLRRKRYRAWPMQASNISKCYLMNHGGDLSSFGSVQSTAIPIGAVNLADGCVAWVCQCCRLMSFSHFPTSIARKCRTIRNLAIPL